MIRDAQRPPEHAICERLNGQEIYVWVTNSQGRPPTVMGLITKANGEELPLGPLSTRRGLISYRKAVEHGRVSDGQGDRIGGWWNETKLSPEGFKAAARAVKRAADNAVRRSWRRDRQRDDHRVARQDLGYVPPMRERKERVDRLATQGHLESAMRRGRHSRVARTPRGSGSEEDTD